MLTWRRKVAIYYTLIESKLLYGLTSCCFTKRQLNRLNAFQNKCLRRIIGVKPSWLSRVSNESVLKRAEHVAFSKLLSTRQLVWFGKVLRPDANYVLRANSFIEDTFQPTTERYIRRVGRPAKEYVPELSKQVRTLFGSLETAARKASDEASWKLVIKSKILGYSEPLG